MKRLAVLMALCPAPSMADTPWAGIWSYDPAWCVNAADIGRVTPAPIAITKTGFTGYENICDISQVSPLTGTNAWHVTLTCMSEGETYTESQIFMVGGGGNSLWIWYGAEEPTRYDRCTD